MSDSWDFMPLYINFYINRARVDGITQSFTEVMAENHSVDSQRLWYNGY